MEITAQVVCIGNEIMLGHIANTNAQYISNKLSHIGIKTDRHIDIPDIPDVIISSIKKAAQESQIVILSGGLGPTVDDLTLECISKALDRKLIFNKKIADSIRLHFKKRKIKMPENNLRQALVPEGAIPITNNIGTAPGLIIPLTPIPSPISPKWERARVRVIIAFPGVPFELYPMFENTAVPYLQRAFPTGHIIKSRIIKITGLPESKVNEKIEDILKISGNVQMGIYPHPEEITVKISVTEKNGKSANATIRKIEKSIKSRLGNYVFGYDEDRLEEVAGKLLLKKKKTLAIAESCTGGLLGNRITDVPGSSKYFLMGIIAYSNESKNKILNVPIALIEKYGAVSKQVARLMAKNVQQLADTDIGISITGIAGPCGGTQKKPVGLVYIAVSLDRQTVCKEYHFLGQRNIIKYKATQAALNMLRLSLCLSKAKPWTGLSKA